jgi:hypothetical protein
MDTTQLLESGPDEWLSREAEYLDLYSILPAVRQDSELQYVGRDVRKDTLAYKPMYPFDSSAVLRIKGKDPEKGIKDILLLLLSTMSRMSLVPVTPRIFKKMTVMIFHMQGLKSFKVLQIGE